MSDEVLGVLRRARVRRKPYVGPWLSDPLLDVTDPSPGPQERVEMMDSLSQAFLVLLEQLTTLERASFLLRKVFAEDYAAIAALERPERPGGPAGPRLLRWRRQECRRASHNSPHLQPCGTALAPASPRARAPAPGPQSP